MRNTGWVLAMLVAAGCGGAAEDGLGGGRLDAAEAAFSEESSDLTAAKASTQQATEIFSGDLFVVSGSGILIRVDPRSTDPAAQLFNAAGEPLPATWGTWQTASARSRVHCARHTTHAAIRLAGLIPGGVYSIFSTTFGPDSNNPVCPFVERSVEALGSFTARHDGTAHVRASSGGCLLGAAQVSYSVVYHFDGATYGAVPNRGESVSCTPSYGADAMRQLLILQQGF